MLKKESDEIKAVKRLKKKLTKDNLWLYILRMLMDKPCYGYEIRNKIKTKFDFSPAVVTGYVVLYKLKREGLVEEKWGEGEGNRPDRKYYIITEKGKLALKKAKEFIANLINNVLDIV